MFQVSWKKQFVLALSLLVIGAAVYWHEFKHVPEQEEKEEADKKMFRLGDSPIKSIKIKNADQTMEFTCLDLDKNLCRYGDQSDWELVEPIKVSADKNSVNGFVTTLTKLEPEDTIELGKEKAEKKASLLKEYGLDQATIDSDLGKLVTVTGQDGKTWKVAVGGKHPIGGKFFALRSKDGELDFNTVYLIPSHFSGKFNKDLTHWRDKRIVALAPHEIGIFEYDFDRFTPFSGERTDGKWTLSAKWLPSLPGDKEAIESFLASLTYIKAKDIVGERKTDKKAKELIWASKKQLEMTIQKKYQVNNEKPEMGEPIKLEFFERNGKDKKEDRLYVRVSNLDPLFELNPGELNKLKKQMKDFRQTRFISSSQRLSVKQVDVSGGKVGDAELKLAKNDDGWKTESSGDAGLVDADKVRTLLDRLSEKQISDFLATQNAPHPSKDALKLRLGIETDSNEADKNSTNFHEFIFWKNKDKYYAQDLARKNEAFEVKKALFEALPKDRMAFFKADKPKSENQQPTTQQKETSKTK